MRDFVSALVSGQKSNLIPEEYDYWGKLIGSWDIDYVEGMGTSKEKHVRGEWHFSRVLEGLGIQDIFICPVPEERTDPAQGEYGATIRMYNPRKKVWDMVYTCLEEMNFFTGIKEDGCIVLTNSRNHRNRWVFMDISQDSFHWQNETLQKDGTKKVWCQVFGTRMSGE